MTPLSFCWVQKTVRHLRVNVGQVLHVLLGCRRRCKAPRHQLGVILRMMAIVLPSQPIVVAIRLKPLYETVHRDVDCVRLTETTRGSLAVLDPAGRGEVCTLSTVVASVEAGMVTTREGDHDLALMLHHLVVRDAILPENIGRDETHLVSQVSRAVLLQVGEQTISQTFEPFPVLRWDSVPVTPE